MSHRKGFQVGPQVPSQPFYPLPPAGRYPPEMAVDQDLSKHASMVTDMWWKDEFTEGGTECLVSLAESEKQSSNVETSSFVDVGPRGMIPTSMGSWEMVRAGSHGSNKTSGQGSENFTYSVPSQGASEWTPGTECGVLMEIDEDNVQCMPHDQEMLLFNMFQSGRYDSAR